jgi:hypothetical protein
VLRVQTPGDTESKTTVLIWKKECQQIATPGGNQLRSVSDAPSTTDQSITSITADHYTFGSPRYFRLSGINTSRSSYAGPTSFFRSSLAPFCRVDLRLV